MLVVHDVNQAAGLMLREPKAFGVVKVRNVGDAMDNSFGRVLWKVVFGKTFLDEVLESFVGTAGHILWSGKIKQTNGSGEIVVM